MKGIGVVNDFFDSLEKGDTSRIITLLSNSFIVIDPVIGRLSGIRAKHYFCLLAKQSVLLKTNFKILKTDAFHFRISWNAQITLKNKIRIRRKGELTMEYADDKISKLTNTHSLTLLLGDFMGVKGYFLGLFPSYKKKFQRRVIDYIDQYTESTILQEPGIKEMTSSAY